MVLRTEAGGGTVRVGVIGVRIASEFLERGDFVVRRPTDEGETVKGLGF